jgi:hypothetical protein
MMSRICDDFMQKIKICVNISSDPRQAKQEASASVLACFFAGISVGQHSNVLLAVDFWIFYAPKYVETYIFTGMTDEGGQMYSVTQAIGDVYPSVLVRLFLRHIQVICMSRCICIIMLLQ